MSLKKYLESIADNQIPSSKKIPYFSLIYENFENQINSLHVIVEPYDDLDSKTFFTEGNWKKANYKNWYYRTDQENSRTGVLCHVHIAREKHLSTQPQYSWNADGSRHDAHKFDDQIPSYAKTLASNILGIDERFLETICIDNYNVLFG